MYCLSLGGFNDKYQFKFNSMELIIPHFIIKQASRSRSATQCIISMHINYVFSATDQPRVEKAGLRWRLNMVWWRSARGEQLTRITRSLEFLILKHC